MQGLAHFLITSMMKHGVDDELKYSISHFFNKTNLEQHLFKAEIFGNFIQLFKAIA